jgi:hypothetical protein
MALMDCYQGDMFFPDQMNSIASDTYATISVSSSMRMRLAALARLSTSFSV